MSEEHIKEINGANYKYQGGNGSILQAAPIWIPIESRRELKHRKIHNLPIQPLEHLQKQYA